jgi:hypothetical protein
MNAKSNSKVASPSTAEIKSLLWPPSILSTESAERFEKVFDQLIVAFDLQDMAEATLVWDFAVASWEISRYTRSRALSFDRSFQKELYCQVEKIKGRRITNKSPTTRLSLNLSPSQSEVADLIRLDGGTDNSDSEIGEILNRTASELDHSYALEKGMNFHKDVEFLIASVTKRRNSALQMLDLYRSGLGKRVDDTMKQILDAEYQVVKEQPQQIESPSVVPSSSPAAGTGDTQHHLSKTAADSTGPREEKKNDL